MSYDKPLPKPEPWSEPFWDGTQEERLLYQVCEDCDASVFYPKRYCPECGGEDFEWEEADGTGTVYTFSTIYQYPPSAFKDDTPYTPAIIELDEDLRMMSVVTNDPEEVECDAAVEVTFDHVTDEFTLPKFELVDA